MANNSSGTEFKERGGKQVQLLGWGKRREASMWVPPEMDLSLHSPLMYLIMEQGNLHCSATPPPLLAQQQLLMSICLVAWVTVPWTAWRPQHYHPVTIWHLESFQVFSPQASLQWCFCVSTPINMGEFFFIPKISISRSDIIAWKGVNSNYTDLQGKKICAHFHFWTMMNKLFSSFFSFYYVFWEWVLF